VYAKNTPLFRPGSSLPSYLPRSAATVYLCLQIKEEIEKEIQAEIDDEIVEVD